MDLGIWFDVLATDLGERKKEDLRFESYYALSIRMREVYRSAHHQDESAEEKAFYIENLV